MSEPTPIKITYSGKSFSVDSINLGPLSLEDLKAAEGICFADFLRRQEQEVLAAMGIPRAVIEAQSRREQRLREIMGDEFIEDNAHAPGALAYWRLIADA